MADVTENDATQSVCNMEDSRREDRETMRGNREETGDTEPRREFVSGDAAQDDKYLDEQHSEEWRGAMGRDVSPFEHMNKFMERLERIDENDLQKLYRDREEMIKKWQVARDEGRVDEFWNQWVEDGGSRSGFGPPPEIMKRWIRFQQEGQFRSEIAEDRMRQGDRLNERERNTSDFPGGVNFNSRGRQEGRGRARDGDEVQGGRGDGNRKERDDESWRGQGEGGWGRQRDEMWGGRGERSWRGRGEGFWRGRGRGCRGRGWNKLYYGVDPDRSYLFEQFNF